MYEKTYAVRILEFASIKGTTSSRLPTYVKPNNGDDKTITHTQITPLISQCHMYFPYINPDVSNLISFLPSTHLHFKLVPTNHSDRLIQPTTAKNYIFGVRFFEARFSNIKLVHSSSFVSNFLLFFLCLSITE